MKEFRNDTKEKIKVRIDDKSQSSGYDWVNVLPGKTIMMDEVVGLKKGLTLSKSPEELKEERKKVKEAEKLEKEKEEAKPETDDKKPDEAPKDDSEKADAEKEPAIVTPKDDDRAVIELKRGKDGKFSETDIIDFNKAQQVKILSEDLKLSEDEIKKLKKEKDRVKKILELQDAKNN